MDNSATELAATSIAAREPGIPGYMHEVYHWAYINTRNAWLLDREPIVNSILWGNSATLRRAVTGEIEPASRVFHAAHVYGEMLPDLARKIGPGGQLDMVDVVPLQVELARRKLREFPYAQVQLADAAQRDDNRYQAVVSYFLLHEIPDDYKHAVVAALLERVQEGGRAVFVDYHQPRRWHPLGPLMQLVFRTLEPFALSLTRTEIRDYASRSDAFQWSKQTFFGGLYQKVVAIRG